MKKDKNIIILLTVCALLCALGTFFALINSNIMYHWFGKYTTLSLLILPFIALLIIIIASIFIFKKNKISFIVPVASALIGCLLAFVLANDASISKIESDYLKHEMALKREVQLYTDESVPAGTYTIEDNSLKWLIPERRLQKVAIGNNEYAYFFIALDTSNRYEGYVYIPDGTPMEWDEFGAFTEPLDIEKTWYYMSLLK